MSPKMTTPTKTHRGHNAVKGKQGFQPTAPKPETTRSISTVDRPAVVSPDGLTDGFGARLLAAYPDTVFVDVDAYMDARAQGGSFRLRLRDARGTDITPGYADPEYAEFNERTDNEFFTPDDKAAFVAKNRRHVQKGEEDSGDVTEYITLTHLRVPGSAEPAAPAPIADEFNAWARGIPVPAGSTLDVGDDYVAPF
ncbi:hypothetical protein [Aeromicrobium sp. 179-A 4D2 NHS]|uniref:hypothetical protein n=1 Tax=Aeromicrobium sp. 179-A 4D2 NHS TaxID=3142375 RepID=UPI0039A1D980